MQRYFMIDIETTGINPSMNRLLQIAVLVADFENGYWVPGDSLVHYQGPPADDPFVPRNPFAIKYMQELYAECNRHPRLSADEVRSILLQFFWSHGCTGAKDTFLMGKCAANFDIPFLVQKGVLVPSGYETDPSDPTKEIFIGDFNHRIYEMSGAIELAKDVLGLGKDDDLSERAFSAYPEIEMPAGQKHDALYDCYYQLRVLNGLIRLTREGSLGIGVGAPNEGAQLELGLAAHHPLVSDR